VDRTGHFFGAFAVTAAVALVGSAAYVFGIPRVENVVWRERPAR
jgi:hypothetical protein